MEKIRLFVLRNAILMKSALFLQTMPLNCILKIKWKSASFKRSMLIFFLSFLFVLSLFFSPFVVGGARNRGLKPSKKKVRALAIRP